MSKKPNMRWLKRDEERVNKLVKNFNAKITRLKAKGIDQVLELPPKLSKKMIKKSALTRDDFNFLMETYEGFTKRGSEAPANAEGFHWATQWAYDVIEKNYKPTLNTERSKRKRELLNHPQYSRGKPTGQTMGQMYTGRAGMGQIPEVQVRPITREMKQKNWNDFMMQMQRQLLDSGKADKANLFKENYLKAMVREGYPEELQELISAIPARIMADVVMFDINADITFVYGKDLMEPRAKALREVWMRAMGREKVYKNEWDAFFSGRKLRTEELLYMFEEIKPNKTEIRTWKERLEKYGYSEAEIAAVFGNEDEEKK